MVEVLIGLGVIAVVAWTIAGPPIAHNEYYIFERLTWLAHLALLPLYLIALGISLIAAYAIGESIRG